MGNVSSQQIPETYRAQMPVMYVSRLQTQVQPYESQRTRPVAMTAGRPKLGDFIRNINFLEAKRSSYYSSKDLDPSNQLDQFVTSIWRELTFDEVKDAFYALVEKVSIHDYPDWKSLDDYIGTGPHFMAKDTAKLLDKQMGRLVEEYHDHNVKLAAGEVRLQSWLAIVAVGSHTTRLEVMEIIADLGMKDYIRILPPSQIVTILRAMDIDLQCPTFDEGFHPHAFGNKLRCHFAAIYGAFTPDQLASVQDEFLQVHYNMLSQMPKLQGKYAEEIEFIVRNFAVMFFKENPYWNLKNVDTFKKHITLVKDLALTDAMGNDTPVDRLTERTMKKMIAALTAEKENATVFENVFDHLMTTIVQLNKNLKTRKVGDHLFSIVGGLFQEMKTFKKEPSDAVLESCRNMIAGVSSCGDTTLQISKMVEEALGGIVFTVKEKAYTGGSSNAKEILLAVKDLLLSGKETFIVKAQEGIDNSQYKKGKVFGWKDLVPDAIMLIDVVGSQPIYRMQDVTGAIRAYANFLDKLLDNLRKARVTSEIQPALVTCMLNCLESPTTDRDEIAYRCIGASVDLTTSNKELVSEVLRRLGKLLEDRGLPWGNVYFAHTVVFLIDRLMSSYYGKGNAILPEHNKLLLSIVKTCGDGDSIQEQFYQHEEQDKTSAYFEIYTHLMRPLVALHAKYKTGQMLAPVIPDLMKWATIAVEEDSEVQGPFLLYMRDIATSMPELLKNFLPQILEMMVNMSDCSQLLWDAINALYGTNPKAVHGRLHDVFGLLDNPIAEHVPYVITLLDKVSTSHPQVFTKDHVGRLLQLCETTDVQTATSTLYIILEVAKHNGRIVAPYFPKLIDNNVFKQPSLNVRAGILGAVGLLTKAMGEKAIDYLMTYANIKNQSICLAVVGTIRSLMPKHVDFMQKHRAKLVKAEQTTANQDVKDVCHQMILVIDGISIEEVFGDVKQAQEDIVELDTKVGATIDTVVVMGEHVVKHHKQIKGIKKNVQHLDKRVDEAEDNIEKTNIKVEEIDNKTMTNAPKWSRDLTKLMNPKSDYDWRLLASRLGYSNNDIRGWAQQNDPCMALLSEWYATHKTSEASFAVLTALQEMNRLDGAAIVENAMKAAEGVVEDEDFAYASPPPIFLSYQWGMQEEVKLLQRHLIMAGYTCWMDIGQMGGGDKLFAKIDNGIRAAKVVICCTTDKYALSPNCNREVNLSVNLGKPIIPLLMEKMAWPPKGSMGPIFSEYLFIRFFQRGAEEETKDNRYWPIPKFQELLMQLNYYVVPDSKLIKKAYKDWWKPIVEEIVIDKNKGKNKSTQVQSTAKAGEKAQPLVFLSYQWGKQTQVKILYQRLTSLGYTVWMDIHQMGGGDSLYDKIDRGLRGCKAIVSCVTPKYAISANCRRELSLADALKKPIIPLLLEQMKWPPDGPMSMVFTELLYINCYRDPDVQMTWKGPSFHELSVKLQEHIPEIGPANFDETSTKGTSGGTPATKKSQPAGRVAPLAIKDTDKAIVTHTMKSEPEAPHRTTRAVVSNGTMNSSKDISSNVIITPRQTPNTKTLHGDAKAKTTTTAKPSSYSATADVGKNRMESAGRSDRNTPSSNPPATASPTKRGTVDSSLTTDVNASINNSQKGFVADSSHGHVNAKITTNARLTSNTAAVRVSPTRTYKNTPMNSNNDLTGSRTQSDNQDVYIRKSEENPGSKSCIIQ